MYPSTWTQIHWFVTWPNLYNVPDFWRFGARSALKLTERAEKDEKISFRLTLWFHTSSQRFRLCLVEFFHRCSSSWYSDDVAEDRRCRTFGNLGPHSALFAHNTKPSSLPQHEQPRCSLHAACIRESSSRVSFDSNTVYHQFAVLLSVLSAGTNLHTFDRFHMPPAHSLWIPFG